jgi:L-aspartate oxidase
VRCAGHRQRRCLSVALRLAERHNVIVLSKGPVSEGSTFYAQGGIAAVFDETDSVESHVEDTLIAGAGIVERQAAEFVASNARQCVQWLIDQGVAFDTQVDAEGSESYHLTREGGHSHRHSACRRCHRKRGRKYPGQQSAESSKHSYY